MSVNHMSDSSEDRVNPELLSTSSDPEHTNHRSRWQTLLVTHLHPISLSCLRGPWPVFQSSLREDVLRFLEPVLPSHKAGDSGEFTHSGNRPSVVTAEIWCGETLAPSPLR